MADNYLEKKMEEHRRGTGVKAARKLSPTGERRGMVSLKIDELRVFVSDASTNNGAAIVRRLRDAGCKVAFASNDDKAGRNLAQASGTRHYPTTFKGSVVDDIVKIWGGIDVLVATDNIRIDNVDVESVILIDKSPGIMHRGDIRVNAINTTGLTSHEISHLCLLLCLKDSACINGVVLGKN